MPQVVGYQSQIARLFLEPGARGVPQRVDPFEPDSGLRAGGLEPFVDRLPGAAGQHEAGVLF